MRADNGFRAWVVSADMGLGHQRAAHALRDIAEGGIITAGAKEITSPEEYELWLRIRQLYEFISRSRDIPLVGKRIFWLLDQVEQIPSFYPFRDLSRPSLEVKFLYYLIRKGLGADLMAYLRTKDLPLITTFYAPAIVADLHGYERVYSFISDADMHRVYVAEDPRRSRINYLTTCEHAARRLRAYGVPEERIFITGWLLPKENIGTPERMEILKKDVARRLFNLDPRDRFWPLHREEVEHFLGSENLNQKAQRPFTVTFAVGGAGAQVDIGWSILRSLRERILAGEVCVNLVAGIRPEVAASFRKCIDELGLQAQIGRRVDILYDADMSSYFDRFNQLMRVTDVLWTKPSELSFYCGLGIPIIMAPPLGPQEEFNRKWLLEVQGGIDQDNPRFAHEWLWDLLWRGRLAESAWDGYLKARKLGTYKAEELLRTGTMRDEYA